jgi:hypothetical protein
VRYFFNLHNDVDTLDEEGVELESETEAWDLACSEARVMAAESVRVGHLDLSHYVEVADIAGRALFRVTFAEVVELRHVPRIERRADPTPGQSEI